MKKGTVIADKYVVERVLGSGGAGVVLSCRHRETDGLFALKILKSPTEEQVERLSREAKLITRLKNEHVCRVFDVGRLPNGGAPYVVMEHLEGEGLEAILKRDGPMPVADAALVVLHACIALSEAHGHGIVHRDIKPANLFRTVAPDGSVRVKVLDFGISKDRHNSDRLTSASAIFGSPPYMSPEQFEATGDVDGRTDVWSLGVTLYEMVTGARPFLGADVVELFTSIKAAPFAAPTTLNKSLPPALDAIIERALGKTTHSRYGTIGELAREVAPLAKPAVAKYALGIIGRLTNTEEIRLRSSDATELGRAVSVDTKPLTDTVPGPTLPLDRSEPRSRWVVSALVAVVIGALAYLALGRAPVPQPIAPLPMPTTLAETAPSPAAPSAPPTATPSPSVRDDKPVVRPPPSRPADTKAPQPSEADPFGGGRK